MSIKIDFSNCEKPISKKEILKIEEYLKIKIPQEMKMHYLKYNGGDPSKTVWENKFSERSDMEVRDFIPFLYSRRFGDDPDFTINGIAKSQWSSGVLPRDLIPFAIDWGGNYFCINHRNEKIYFFARDVWSENITKEKNLEVNTKFLEESFDSFLAHLTENTDE